MPYGITWKRFAKDLRSEVQEDNVSNGAAALAYYLMLSIFPAMIALISLLPFLPIPNLENAILDILNEALPGQAAQMFTQTINEVVSEKREGLLSLGLLLAIWAASNGMFAIMQQLNITYDVVEGRPFWKTRGTALLLTLFFGVLVIGAFSLVVAGGYLQSFLSNSWDWGTPLLVGFAIIRWTIITAALLLAFAVTYYYGPDVEQKFRFITPGSILGVALLIAASLAFKFYVDNFGKYNATYGSLGAMIALMLWLNITGLVILLGSEINALIEHYSSEGKDKGEKREPAQAA
ncbi:MAG: YihY/virulence factor BrkB family protein [Bdellovibrionota bacterium]